MTTTIRRSLGVLLAAVLVGSLAPAAAAADVADMVPLPVPTGATASSVTGGDPTGRYLVGTADLPDTTAGLVWRNGRFTRIDASSVPHAQMFYDDVNRDGVVVGERMTDFSSFHRDAFLYRDGRFTLLPAPNPGDETEAVAINSRGDVLGNSFSDGAWRIVVWPADSPGTVRVLTMPDGRPATALARDIDEDGTVVGTLAPFPPGTAYVWPADGTPHALPIPADSAGGGAVAIRLGMVAGSVLVPDPSDPSVQRSRPTVWNLNTGGVTLHHEAPGGVLSINRDGTIGTAGAVVHADGRVVQVGGVVEVLTDRGGAAGTTEPFGGIAVRWPRAAR